jgi:DNA-binding transcriptional LysR family regulator
MIESSWLRTFAVFAGHANLSRAARELHLSQPAVHAHLARLSDALGAPLYQRVGRGLVLTREGIEVAAFARAHEEEVEALTARLRGTAAEPRVVVAAGAGAFLHILPAGLRAFRAANRARIELVNADARAAVQAVLTGSAHVGVAVLGSSVDPALDRTTLTEVAQVLVVPREHRLGRRRRVRLADLEGESLVVPPEGRPHRALVAAALSAAGIAWRVGAVASGWELILRFVELGMGLAIVNGCVRVPRTLAAHVIGELPPVGYAIFTRPRPPPAAAALVRAVRSHAEAWRDGLRST